MAEERHTTSIDIKVDDRQVVALGEEIERAFSSKVIEKFNEGLERQTKAMKELLKEQKKLAQDRDSFEKDAWKRQFRKAELEGSGRARGAGGAGGAGGGVGVGGVALGVVIGNAITGAMRRLGAAGGALAGGQNVTAGMLAATVPGGGLLSAATSGIQQYYGEFAQRRIQQANIYGQTRLTAGGQQRRVIQAALAAGMMGDEGIQQAANIGEQTGMVGGDLADVLGPGRGQGGVGGAFQMSQFGGVRNIGRIVGAAGVAGPQVDPQRAQKLMFDAVGSGLVAGLRESRLDQFVVSVGQFVEQSRTQGIRIEPETVLSITRGIASSIQLRPETRLQGEALQRFVLGMMPALQRIGEGASFADMMALETLGVTGKKGGVGILEALELRETDEGQRKMFSGLIGMFREGGRFGGMNERMRAFTFRDLIAKQLGVQLSQTAARELVGGGDVDEAIDRMMGVGVERGEEFAAGRFTEGARISGIKRKEAVFKEQRIAVGGAEKLVTAVGQLRATDLAAARAILPMAADVVTQLSSFIETAITALADWAGPGGSWEKMTKRYNKAAGKGGAAVFDLLNPDFDVLFGGEPGKGGARRNDPGFNALPGENPLRRIPGDQQVPGRFNAPLQRPEGMPEPKLRITLPKPAGDSPASKATSAADQLAGAAQTLYALAAQLGETSESDLAG